MRWWFLLLPFALLAEEPTAVYLTWKGQPDTTMSVQWISKDEEDSLLFKKEGEETWSQVKGCHVSLPNAKQYNVHFAELTNLSPATNYQFKLAEPKLYKFHTLPSTENRQIRFVVGGDMYHDSLPILNETNVQAAKTNPDFALVGGDIAYAANKLTIFPENTNRWIEWISAWTETMITPEGHLIPILATLGNHDVNGRYGQNTAQASTFYTLFAAMPGLQGYNVVDFGNYMSILILDSGHTHPVYGEQAKWLEKTLSDRQNIPFRFALYHVPAFPSVRKMTTKISPEIRGCWVPLFEKYRLTAAFEHHDHAYKRTHLIRDGKAVKEDGVLYLGDGGWGAKEARVPKKPSETWFLAEAIAARHFIFVTLDGKEVTFTAIDHTGKVIDRYTR